jgi:hypothetical protein
VVPLPFLEQSARFVGQIPAGATGVASGQKVVAPSEIHEMADALSGLPQQFRDLHHGLAALLSRHRLSIEHRYSQQGVSGDVRATGTGRLSRPYRCSEGAPELGPQEKSHRLPQLLRHPAPRAHPPEHFAPPIHMLADANLTEETRRQPSVWRAGRETLAGILPHASLDQETVRVPGM